MKQIWLILLLSGLIVACTESSDDDEETAVNDTTDYEAVGTSINTLSSALASLGSLSASSLQPSAGVANDYCDENGGPQASSSAIAQSSNDYASANGYCQATFNAQSPDTARGAMYLAGGVACEVYQAGLLDALVAGADPTTSTLDIEFGTTCWGSQAEVDAFVADTGSSISLSVTMARFDTSVSGSYVYEFFVGFTVGSDVTGMYLHADDDNIAALSYTSTSAWAVRMNLTDQEVLYEGIDGDNSRRVRLLVQGTLDSDNSGFSAVTSIEGFHNQGSGNQILSTFTGNLSDGLLGNLYGTATSSNEDNCYLPTNSSAACSGITSISSSGTEAGALYSGLSDAVDSLSNYATSFINFDNVDPSDVDITD